MHEGTGLVRESGNRDQLQSTPCELVPWRHLLTHPERDSRSQQQPTVASCSCRTPTHGLDQNKIRAANARTRGAAVNISLSGDAPTVEHDRGQTIGEP